MKKNSLNGIIFSYSPVVIRTVIAFRCGSHNFNARLFIDEEKPDCSSLILSKIKKNFCILHLNRGIK